MNMFSLCLPPVLLIASLTFTVSSSPLHRHVATFFKRGLPSGWSYLGCVAEPSGGARVLTTKITDSSPSMTQETCLNSCINAGYSFAGLEFGAECWCGNNPTANLNVLPDTSCSTSCGGNSGEKCGGTYTLALFGKSSKIASTWTYVGCFSDSAQRTLPTTSSISTKMTPETCQAACQSSGCTFSGLEAGSECWCSDSIANGARVADSKCSTTCSGSSEKCGGTWNIGIYRRTLSPAWKDLGCYVDDGVTRTLAGPLYKDATMTSAKCQAFCFTGGYSYAAPCAAPRRTLAASLQEIVEISSRCGITLCLEVDENLPESLPIADPDNPPYMDCVAAVLKWIIRAISIDEDRKGRRALVACRSHSRATDGNPSILEISVSGEAVTFTAGDLSRIAKIAKVAVSPSRYQSAATYRDSSCLAGSYDQDPNLHRGHAECIANGAFLDVIKSLSCIRGKIWVENEGVLRIRAVIQFKLPSFDPKFLTLGDDIPPHSVDGGSILYTIRSPTLNYDDALEVILPELGFKVRRTRHEYELCGALVPQNITAIMTDSPDLMDAYMFFMNGLEAGCRIHQFEEDRGLPPTPVVLLLARDRLDMSASEWARALDEGVVSVLYKPIKKGELARVIQRYCSRRGPQPEYTFDSVIEAFTGKRFPYLIIDEPAPLSSAGFPYKEPQQLDVINSSKLSITSIASLRAIPRLSMPLAPEQTEKLKEALQEKIDALEIEVNKEGAKGIKADNAKITALRNDIQKYQQQIDQRNEVVALQLQDTFIMAILTDAQAHDMAESLEKITAPLLAAAEAQGSAGHRGNPTDEKRQRRKAQPYQAKIDAINAGERDTVKLEQIFKQAQADARKDQELDDKIASKK
ncbi:hypothetical protein FRB90_012118 [Tulasnella sp. 427]|nr:hypothetical protein FRB90_012118 [Tulasnella sp. 427]